jgi:hypothetical protein
MCGLPMYQLSANRVLRCSSADIKPGIRLDPQSFHSGFILMLSLHLLNSWSGCTLCLSHLNLILKSGADCEMCQLHAITMQKQVKRCHCKYRKCHCLSLWVKFQLWFLICCQQFYIMLTGVQWAWYFSQSFWALFVFQCPNQNWTFWGIGCGSAIGRESVQALPVMSF